MELLKLGSSGKLAELLQRKLVFMNYNLNVTGNFDQATQTAVIDFQAHNNLVADGEVGGKTWTQIYLKTEHPRNTTTRTERHNNILHLHPTVRTAVVKVFIQLQSENIPLKIYEAFRYPERQTDLFAQGRTKPGPIVTYAKPWSSYHQYGLAVDFVLFINGTWSWNVTGVYKNYWSRLHQIGATEGLVHLDFEKPHLQLAGISSSALRHGIYPPNGDKTWFDNMKTAIGT